MFPFFVVIVFVRYRDNKFVLTVKLVVSFMRERKKSGKLFFSVSQTKLFELNGSFIYSMLLKIFTVCVVGMKWSAERIFAGFFPQHFCSQIKVKLHLFCHLPFASEHVATGQKWIWIHTGPIQVRLDSSLKFRLIKGHKCDNFCCCNSEHYLFNCYYYHIDFDAVLL